MSFKLDWSKFKKAGSKGNHTTLRHDDGHEIKINHEALSSKMKAQLKKLPVAMAEGGDPEDAEQSGIRIKKPELKVEEITETPDSEFKVESLTPNEELQSSFDRIANPKSAAEEPVQDVNLDQSSPSQMPPAEDAISIGQAAPSRGSVPLKAPMLGQEGFDKLQQGALQGQPAPGVPSMGPALPPGPSMEAGYTEQLAGIRNEATAQGKANKMQADAHERAVEAQADAQIAYEEELETLRDERLKFQEDIKNSHIDPEHYWSNRTDAQKWNTFIGLALGGFGAAAGQQNLAAEYVDKAIDRDIAAQRANLDKKQSLLSANLAQFKNEKDAMEMTKVMMTDIATHQLNEAAARAATPMAAARAQQLAGQLQQQIAPLYQQLEMRRALDAGQKAGINKSDPASYVPFLNAPEGHKTQILKDIKTRQDIIAKKDHLMKLFDQVQKDMSPTNRLMMGGGEPASLGALKAEGLTLVQDLEGSVQQQAMEAFEKNLVPHTWDITDKAKADRRAGFENWLNSRKAAPTAKAYGLDLEKFQSTSSAPEASHVRAVDKMSPEQQKLYNWAQKNPNDPRAKLVLKKLGM